MHGLFWDSLLDAWGRAVLEECLKSQGLDVEQLSPLLQLSYLGSHGMGALNYFPDADSEQGKLLHAVSLVSMARSAGINLSPARLFEIENLKKKGTRWLEQAVAALNVTSLVSKR